MDEHKRNIIIRRNLEFFRYYHYPVNDIINYLNIVLNDPYTYDHDNKYHIIKLFVQRFLINIVIDYIFYEHEEWWKYIQKNDNITLHSGYTSQFDLFKIDCLEFELNFKECDSVPEFITIFNPFKKRIEDFLDVSENFFVNIQKRNWRDNDNIIKLPSYLSNYYESFLQRHANYLIPLFYNRYHMPRYTHHNYFRNLHWTYKIGFYLWYVRHYRKRYMDFLLEMSKNPIKRFHLWLERTSENFKYFCCCSNNE
jgi:hypothetical protein